MMDDLEPTNHGGAIGSVGGNATATVDPIGLGNEESREEAGKDDDGEGSGSGQVAPTSLDASLLFLSQPRAK